MLRKEILSAHKRKLYVCVKSVAKMVNKKYSVMQQDHRQPRCNVRFHSIAKYISRRHHFQNLLVITLSLMHFFWLHVVVVVVVVIDLFPATFIFNYRFPEWREVLWFRKFHEIRYFTQCLFLLCRIVVF